MGALHSRLLTPYPVTSSGKAAPGPDPGIRHRTQIGMFRPIRFDHTNCLQVAIKSIQFQFLHRRKRTLRAFSRSFRYRGIRTSGFWRMDTWDWLYAAGFCRDWNEITISFLGFMALTDPVKCSVRTGWIQDACDVGMGGKGCVR